MVVTIFSNGLMTYTPVERMPMARCEVEAQVANLGWQEAGDHETFRFIKHTCLEVRDGTVLAPE